MSSQNMTKPLIMKKIFSLLSIVIVMTSCKGQEYGKERFDLSKLNFNMNADNFYSEAMNKENIKLSSGKQYVEKDTITENDLDWSGDRDKIFGVQFNVKGYSPKDTVAIFKNLNFSRLEAMTNETGSLMMVSATGKCTSEEFKKFLQTAIKEYKNPVVEDKEFSYFKNYHYTWILNDRIVQLVSNTKIDFEQTPYNIISEKEKKAITEIEKDRLEEIHLFICKTPFEKKLRGKLNSGNWSSFK